MASWAIILCGVALAAYDLTQPLHLSIHVATAKRVALAIEWTDRTHRSLRNAPQFSQPIRAGGGEVELRFPSGGIDEVQVLIPPMAEISNIVFRRGFNTYFFRSAHELSPSSNLPRSGLDSVVDDDLRRLTIPVPVMMRYLLFVGVLLIGLGSYLSLKMPRSPSDVVASMAWGGLGRKDLIFSALVTLAVFLGTALQLHQSSIGTWAERLTRSADADLLAGEPNGHRSDDWLVWTPNILSHSITAPPFGEENSSLGGGRAPLLMSMPVWHLSTLFRPQLWGFFVLGAEYGYAWLWQLKLWGLFWSVVVTARLLGAYLRHAIFAGVLLLGSAFVQWWLSSMLPEIVTWALLGLSAALLLSVAAAPSVVLCAGVLLTISLINFALFLYPPFQIPLVLLLMVVWLSRWFLPEWRAQWRSKWQLRIMTLAGAALVVLLVIAHWYADVAETIALLQQTSYPGQRVSHGGGVGWFALLSGWLEPFSNRFLFAASLRNPNEGAGFMVLWPALIAAAVAVRGDRRAMLIAPMMGFLALLTTWMVWGAPEFLERLLGLTLVPPHRALVAIGVADVLILALVLSAISDSARRSRWPALINGILFGGLVLGVIQGAEPDFLTLGESIILFSAITIAVLAVSSASALRSVVAPGAMVVLACTATINPLQRGLEFLLQNRLVEEVRLAVAERGDGRFLVEDFLLPNLVKVAGVTVINGVKFLPDLRLMRLLDPAGSANEIYNRYAHAAVELVPGADPPRFRLVQPDLYVMQIDPCGLAAERAAIRFVVMGSRRWREFSCLSPVVRRPLYRNLWILEVRRSAVPVGSAIENDDELVVGEDGAEPGKVDGKAMQLGDRPTEWGK